MNYHNQEDSRGDSSGARHHIKPTHSGMQMKGVVDVDSQENTMLAGMGAQFDSDNCERLTVDQLEEFDVTAKMEESLVDIKRLSVYAQCEVSCAVRRIVYALTQSAVKR